MTESLRQQYAASPSWKNGQFHNLEATAMGIGVRSLPKLLYKQFFVNNGRMPQEPLPVVPFNAEEFLSPSDQAKFIWYGHSVLLMRLNNKTLLIDPMLGPDASPIAPFTVKRFSSNTLAILDKLPSIDLVLLSHDHYDHLDLASIEKLKHKARHYFVALGVERHLMKWGVPGEMITTFDWWSSKTVDGIDITLTPSRHFSGRGIRDRFKSLWGGWAFRTAHENIYFSGDGGYGRHFKTVGERLGPFDIGFMECGQYNELWHQIHMYPEEAIQAAKDAQVKTAVPVHWGAFALAQHSWKEPVERFVKEGRQQQLAHITPALGQLFTIEDDMNDPWWEKFV